LLIVYGYEQSVPSQELTGKELRARVYVDGLYPDAIMDINNLFVDTNGYT